MVIGLEVRNKNNNNNLKTVRLHVRNQDSTITSGLQVDKCQSVVGKAFIK